MSEECLICGAPLEYLEQDTVMECAVCHKKEPSKTRCVHVHYVCNSCHTQGLDGIFGLCLASDSTDPIALVRQMMAMPFCHMHGPEHHVMVGAALPTAYKNAGGELELEPALREIASRGRAVHGHRDPLHTAGRRALGPEQPHDRPGAGSHRPGGRAAVLQAGFLAGDPGLPSTSHGSSWA